MRSFTPGDIFTYDGKFGIILEYTKIWNRQDRTESRAQYYYQIGKSFGAWSWFDLSSEMAMKLEIINV